MKTLTLVLFCVASVFSQSIQDRVNKFDKPKSYKVEYDKFANKTTVSVTSTIKADKRRWVEMHAYVEIGETTSYLLIFSMSERFLFNHTPVRFLLDGQLLDVGETGIEYTPGVIVSAEHWSKIVAAKTVEIQVGPFEGTFDEKTLQRFKNLASLTK